MGKTITVMVTGVGGGGHGEQILKALKLSEKKYKIVGTDMMPQSAGLKTVDYPYLLPSAASPDYFDKLFRLCKKHDVKVLFHGSEPELKAMSNNRDEIEARGIHLFLNPKEVIDTCMDKFKTMTFLSKNGFNHPQTISIKSEEDIKKVDFFPAVIKPSVGSGGSANTMIAQNEKETALFCRYMLNIMPEFIVQEYVGTGDSEYTVGVLLSKEGEVINSIAVKRFIMSSMGNRTRVKNRTGNPKFGDILAISSGISQGKIGCYPEVCEPCEKMALSLGCRCSVNMQCRFVDGKVYVFEINPRFSGTTSLRAMAGYNEPDILIRKYVFGEKIQPRFKYKTGFIMRSLHENFIEESFISSLNAGDFN